MCHFNLGIYINFILETLNKLLGSTDCVADIKKGFIQNLYTPSKIFIDLKRI